MTIDIYTLLVTMVAFAMLIALLAIALSWILYRRENVSQGRVAALESEKTALKAGIAALEAENLELKASNAAHEDVLQQIYPNELALAKARARALLGLAG